MDIQWYPGHMAKAMRLIRGELKKTDVILVLGDARAVKKSINADFIDSIRQKKYVFVFNKADLADNAVTKAWTEFFRAQNKPAFFTDSIHKSGFQEVYAFLSDHKKALRYSRPLRVMAAGIPNVGKSMFINSTANRASAKTGNRPGVTRSTQWIKAEEDTFYLLDTPGILPPKFQTQQDAKIIAAIGGVRQEVFDNDDLALFVIDFLMDRYQDLLKSRYKLDLPAKSSSEVFEQIALRRGFKLKGGGTDYTRCAEMILSELRNGKIGRISFDWPEAADEFF